MVYNPEEPTDEEAIDDPTPALLACLLLCMSCPKCEGTGAVDMGKGKDAIRCQCRDTSYKVALTTLREEGLAK